MGVSALPCCVCVLGLTAALAGCGGGVGGSGAGVPYRAPAKPAATTTPSPARGHGCTKKALASFAADGSTSGAERVAVRRLIGALAGNPPPGNCATGTISIPAGDRPTNDTTTRCLAAAGYVALLAHLPASAVAAPVSQAAKTADEIINAHEHRGDTYCVAP